MMNRRDHFCNDAHVSRLAAFRITVWMRRHTRGIGLEDNAIEGYFADHSGQFPDIRIGHRTRNTQVETQIKRAAGDSVIGIKVVQNADTFTPNQRGFGQQLQRIFIRLKIAIVQQDRSVDRCRPRRNSLRTVRSRPTP